MTTKNVMHGKTRKGSVIKKPQDSQGMKPYSIIFIVLLGYLLDELFNNIKSHDVQINCYMVVIN